jgi:hypothetical protein
MRANKFAKSVEEFDRRFDEGEDIHGLVNMTKAKIVRHGKKVRFLLFLLVGPSYVFVF